MAPDQRRGKRNVSGSRVKRKNSSSTKRWCRWSWYVFTFSFLFCFTSLHCGCRFLWISDGVSWIRILSFDTWTNCVDVIVGTAPCHWLFRLLGQRNGDSGVCHVTSYCGRNSKLDPCVAQRSILFFVCIWLIFCIFFFCILYLLFRPFVLNFSTGWPRWRGHCAAHRHRRNRIRFVRREWMNENETRWGQMRQTQFQSASQSQRLFVLFCFFLFASVGWLVGGRESIVREQASIAGKERRRASNERLAKKATGGVSLLLGLFFTWYWYQRARTSIDRFCSSIGPFFRKVVLNNTQWNEMK